MSHPVAFCGCPYPTGSPAYLCLAMLTVFRHCQKLMKTISFFSAKGGTGKTTFNLLLASWLRYKQGKRVAVLDMDGPEFSLSYTRKREEKYLLEHGVTLPEGWLYPICELPFGSMAEKQEALKRHASFARESDYVILDFGGSFGQGDPVLEFVRRGLIDLVAIPVELDGMILSSGKALAMVLGQLGQKSLLFFNKVHGREKPELYAELELWLGEAGLSVSRSRIKNTVKLRRDSDNGSNFLRSTVGFPEKEILEVNPALVRLFEEVSGHGT